MSKSEVVYIWIARYYCPTCKAASTLLFHDGILKFPCPHCETEMTKSCDDPTRCEDASSSAP